MRGDGRGDDQRGDDVSRPAWERSRPEGRQCETNREGPTHLHTVTSSCIDRGTERV